MIDLPVIKGEPHRTSSININDLPQTVLAGGNKQSILFVSAPISFRSTTYGN